MIGFSWFCVFMVLFNGWRIKEALAHLHGMQPLLMLFVTSVKSNICCRKNYWQCVSRKPLRAHALVVALRTPSGWLVSYNFIIANTQPTMYISHKELKPCSSFFCKLSLVPAYFHQCRPVCHHNKTTFICQAAVCKSYTGLMHGCKTYSRCGKHEFQLIFSKHPE